MATMLSCIVFLLGLLSSPCVARTPVKSRAVFEYDAYSCDAQTAAAVLSVAAGGSGKPLLSLTSVLDVSGSMDDSEEKEEGELTKLELLKRTNNFIVDHLLRKKGAHKFGIVTFSTDVKELSPLQVLTPKTAKSIKKKINATEAAGLTNLLDGTLTGLKQQTLDEDENYIRAVFVFTDGEPTEGEIRKSKIVQAVKKALDATNGDVFLYTFGYGEVYYELLKEMADAGEGVMYLINQEEDIPEAFGAALGGLLSEVATKLMLRIKPIGDAKIVDVLHGGVERRFEDGSVEIFLGDLFKQEERDLVVKVNLTDSCEGTETIEADVVYRDAVSFKNVTRHIPVSPIKRRPYVQPMNGTTDVGMHVIRYDTADTLKIAAKALDDDDPEQCIRIVEKAEQRFVTTGYIRRPYIRAVQKDLETFRKDVAADPDDDVRHRATLQGIIDAVEKQRTGLTDKDKYETVDITTTASKRKTSATAASQVLESGEIYFPMNVTYAVGDGRIVGDAMEIEVALTLRPVNTGEFEPSLSITTVLDQSGSMAGRPFDLLIEVQKILIDHLVNYTDSAEIDLGIVFFSDSVTTFLPLTDIDDNDRQKWDELKRKLDSETAYGGTSLNEGLRVGIDQQIKQPKCAGLQAVFVFSDGNPTDADPPEILDNVRAQLATAEEAIFIYTFGLGDFSEALIDGLDMLTDGRKFILEKPEDAREAFGRSTGQALSALAKDVNIDITPNNDDVEILSVRPVPQRNATARRVTYDVLLEGERRDVFIVVRVPKDDIPSKLLDVEVSYDDASSCETLKSGVITIGSNETGTTDRRKVEIDVIETLEDSVEQCKNGTNITQVIADIEEALRIVHDASMPEELEDLHRDLFTIRSMLEQAHSQMADLSESCLTLEVFIDVVETQRSEGVVDLEVQDTYGTQKQEETRSVFTGRPERPKRDPFRVQYVDAPDEISTAAQNLSMEMGLNAIGRPTDPLPSSVIFVIDASFGTTKTEIKQMRLTVIDTIEAFKKSNVYTTSSISIVVHGSTVMTSLSSTPFSNVTTDDVDGIFGKIEIGGGGSFSSAVQRGIGILSNETGHDLVMVAFTSGNTTSIRRSTAASDATSFVDIEVDLSVRLTFIPVVLKPGVEAEAYLKAYPPWVRHSIVRKDTEGSAIADIKASLYNVAAKRVLAKVVPNTGVVLHSVGAGLSVTATSFILKDISYDEKRGIPIDLEIGQNSGFRTLFFLSFTYDDMRSFYNWEKKTAGYNVRRIPEEILRALKEIRDRSIGVSNEIRAAVERDDYNAALQLTSHEMAIILRTDVKHRHIDEIFDDLKKILQKTHAVLEKDFEKDDLLALIKSFEKSLDVQTFIAETEKPKEPEPAEEKGEDEGKRSTPPKPIEVLNVDFDDDVPIPNTADKVTVEVKLEPPLHSGLLVDAHATIIVDRSTGANQKIVESTLGSLLSSLAGRRAVRSIEIFSWNKKLTSVYTNRNFKQIDVPEAAKSLQSVDPSGEVAYSVVVDQGIVDGLNKEVTIKMLYWIVTSPMPGGEQPMSLLETAAEHLSRGNDTLAVISFYAGLDDRSIDFLEEVGRLSGGTVYQLDQTKEQAPDIERKNRIDDVARAAVVWVDDSFSKDIVIDFNPLGSATVLDVEASESEDIVTTTSSIQITSQRYVHSISVNITVGFGSQGRRLLQQQTGNITQLLNISGQYYNLREQRIVTIPESIVSVEPLDQKILDRINRLQHLLREVAMDAMKQLGSNRLKEALISMTQSQILSNYSGIDRRSTVEGDSENYRSIEQDLEDFTVDRNVTSLQDATTDIGLLSADIPYTSDTGRFLKTNHTPISALQDPTIYKPVINIQLGNKDDNKGSVPREMAITAVFDAVDYKLLIDHEIPSLNLQMKVVENFLEQLIVDEGIVVTLTAIGSRYKDSSKLSSIVLDADSIKEIGPYLDNINATGSPVDLYSSLKEGLESLQNVQNTTERIVLLLSSASSVCLVEDPKYEELLVPYITYPINPVKVMTYVVGITEAPKTDPISDLTSGNRFIIKKMREIFPVIDNSIANIKDTTIRGVQLRILPESWNDRPVRIESGGLQIKSYPIWTAALRDMKAGSTQSIELSNALDRWKGDADLLHYAVSYFRSDEQRWYVTPNQTIRIRRAPAVVLEEREKQRSQTVKTVNKGLGELMDHKIPKAAETMHGGLSVLDLSPYQDDSVIGDLIEYLSDVYYKILHLLQTNSDNVDEIVDEIINAAGEYNLVVDIEVSPEPSKSHVKSAMFFVGMLGALGVAALIA